MSDRDILTVTAAAAEQIRAMRASMEADDLDLRIEIIGGAPSGFAYDLFFDERRPDDHVVEQQSIRVVITPDSVPYLRGSTLDWLVSQNGAGFQVQNPNEPAK